MKQMVWWRSFSGFGKFGIGVIGLMVGLCMVSFFFLGDLHRLPSGDAFEAPSLSHWLGTDDLGIDIFAQISHGAGVSMGVGFSTALLAGVGGSILGILAGYHGKWVDKLVTGLCDVMMSIPSLPLMIVLGAFFGASIAHIILVIVLLSWVGPARTVRSRVLSMRSENYIVAAKSYGAGFGHLAVRHFIPGLLPIISVSMIRIVSHAVVAEAGLSYLGLGDPLSKSWGIILNRAINFSGIYFTDFWKWWLMSPLVSLMILVVAVAFISRDLEKIVNTKV